MKKSVIKISFVAMLILVGCIGCTNIINQNVKESNSSDKIESKTVKSTTHDVYSQFSSNVLVNEQSNKDKGKFYLGMSKDDIVSTLDSMKVSVENEIEVTSDSKSWDWGNRVLETEDFSFSFDKQHKLYEIMICNGSTPTKLGLKIADSLHTMEKLYGKNYILYQTPRYSTYEYTMNGYYFEVIIKGGKITKWGISKYKFDR